MKKAATIHAIAWIIVAFLVIAPQQTGDTVQQARDSVSQFVNGVGLHG